MVPVPTKPLQNVRREIKYVLLQVCGLPARVGVEHLVLSGRLAHRLQPSLDIQIARQPREQHLQLFGEQEKLIVGAVELRQDKRLGIVHADQVAIGALDDTVAVLGRAPGNQA